MPKCFIPRRELRKQNPYGVQLFLLMFYLCLGRFFDIFVSEAEIRLFFVLKMFYCVDGWMGGWVDGWMDGWVGCDFLPPSIFLIFKYDNKQDVLIPKMGLKVASA